MVNLSFIMRSVSLILAFILLGIAILFAQADKGIFDPATITKFNQSDGLPQNTIIDFRFDNLGYIWFATWGGLSRFDGQHFKNDFGYKESSAAKNRIAKLIKKSRDTLYALTFEQKILTITNGNIAGYEAYSVQKHGILIGNSQVSVVAPSSINDSNFEDYSRKNNWAIQYACMGFSYGNDSFGIIGKDLFLYSRDGLFKTLPMPPHDYKTYNDGWKIYVLEKNVVVLNNETHCIDVYTIEGKTAHLPLPSNDKTWRIYKSTDNHSLFVADGKKLFELHDEGLGKNLVFTKLLNNFQDSMSINRIYNKDNKYLIISTVNKGFYIFHKNSVQVFNAPAKNFYAYYLRAQVLMPDDSTILTGNSFLFDKKGYKGSIDVLKPVYTTDPMLFVDLNRMLFRDSKNFYWYTREIKDSATHYLLKAPYPGSAEAVKILTLGTTVYYLFEDSKGNIWVNNKDNLGYLERGTANYVTILSAISKDKFITPLKINCYAEDNKGRIIIGSTLGVFLLDMAQPKKILQKYLLDSTEIRFLKFNQQTGSLWIGTYGKGLWILKKSGELLQVPADRENTLSIMHYAITDQHNRVWFCTNNGLYVTTKKYLDDFETDHSIIPYYYKLSTYDGLADNEFNGGCQFPMILQRDGSLTASSVAGLVWINTNDITFNFPGKTLELAIHHGNKIFPANIQQLDIAADDNEDLLIEALAPDFSPAYNVQLQYKIIKKGENGVPAWLDVNEQRHVDFPFLPAGDYEIQFRKRTGLNNNDFIYSTITIHKKPYWYQTIYLYPILLLSLLVIGYLLYLWRMLALRQKNKALNEKIIIATANLRDKNEELLQTVQTRDKLILLFNHDLSTPLFYINRLAKSIVEENKRKGGDGTLIELLANSTQDLEELMNEMLLWIQVQQKNSTIQLINEPVNVIELLERNFDLFRHRLQQHQLQTRLLVPYETTIIIDRRVINSILYNLITNAIKYTENGVIQIEVVNDDLNKSHLCLLIRSKSNTSFIPDHQPDNIYKDMKEMIKTNTPTTNEQSRQIGLQLVMSFATMLNIGVSFDNTFPEIFTVKISGLKFLKQ